MVRNWLLELEMRVVYGSLDQDEPLIQERKLRQRHLGAVVHQIGRTPPHNSLEIVKK